MVSYTLIFDRCTILFKNYTTILYYSILTTSCFFFFFFFQAEDGIRDYKVTGVQTCALPICPQSKPERAKAPKISNSRRIPISFAASGLLPIAYNWRPVREAWRK